MGRNVPEAKRPRPAQMNRKIIHYNTVTYLAARSIGSAWKHLAVLLHRVWNRLQFYLSPLITSRRGSRHEISGFFFRFQGQLYRSISDVRRVYEIVIVASYSKSSFLRLRLTIKNYLIKLWRSLGWNHIIRANIKTVEIFKERETPQSKYKQSSVIKCCPEKFCVFVKPHSDHLNVATAGEKTASACSGGRGPVPTDTRWRIIR